MITGRLAFQTDRRQATRPAGLPSYLHDGWLACLTAGPQACFAVCRPSCLLADRLAGFLAVVASCLIACLHGGQQAVLSAYLPVVGTACRTYCLQTCRVMV